MAEIEDLSIYNYQDDVEIKNALVILSFPTIGMISNIVANFLVKNLELERIGAIISNKLQPAAIIQNGIPTPPIRIYAGNHVCGPAGECDQLIIITSDLPIEKKYLGPLADMIIEWCSNRGIENIVTIEGINSEELELGEKAKVLHALSTPSSGQFITELDTESLENGMVSGLSGLLLWKGNMQNFPIISILAEAHQKFPDSRSAAAVLKALNKMLPEIDMDPEPLLDKATEIEKQIRESLSQMGQKQQQSVSEATQGFFA